MLGGKADADLGTLKLEGGHMGSLAAKLPPMRWVLASEPAEACLLRTIQSLSPAL